MKNNLEKYFFLHEVVIDVFYDKFYIHTMEKMSFHIDHVSILCSMEFGNTVPSQCIKNTVELNKYYAEKFSETSGVEIQRQHWGGNIQLSIENIYVENITSFN